jgi:cell wall-associated NlpC family hydrolase
VLPSDLTAIVFSNLLWFLLTLCLGSVLVTRPSRPERAGQARRGLLPARLVPAWQSRVKAAETRQTFRCGAALASPRAGRLCRSSAHQHDWAASGPRGAPGRSQNARSLASTGAAVAESTGAAVAETEPLTFRVSDYLVLSDYPVAGEELAAGDEFAADDVVAVSGETIARAPADALAGERLAPLPPVDWSTATPPPRRSSVWPRPLTRLVPAGLPPRAASIVASVPAGSGRALVRRASGPARHRRPRPAAREKALAQVAAVAIAVVMAGAGTGLGLHMASGGGHASAVPPGGLAASIFAGTAPPAITKPTTLHVTTRAHTTSHHARPADSRFVTLRDRLQAVQAQLAATLNLIGFLGHDVGAGNNGRLLLPSLTRKAARLRVEIVRMEQRLGAAARRTPAPPIRLTSATKHAPANGGQARHRSPVARTPVGEAGRRAEAVAYAEAQLGKPYVWGGAGPYGFDCSGLVMMAWQAGGVSLPHFTGDQWADAYHISGSQLEPGDLVFSNGFGHVQMYVGHGEVIQAPHTGEVVGYAPLPPPVQVDGYASVFPPGHLAPRGRHVGGPGTIGLADTGKAASVAGTTQPAGMAGHRPVTTGITGHGLTINRGCEHHRACGHHRAGGQHRIRRHHPGTGRRSPAAHGISHLRGKAGDL